MAVIHQEISSQTVFPRFGTSRPVGGSPSPDALAIIEKMPPGRDEVVRLEAALLDHPQAHIHIPVEHLWGDGVYVRKIVIPKGTIATGRIHRFDHVSIVVSGDMTIWTEDSGVHRVTGPCFTEVKAGTKRAGYAHEETVWMTAHRADRPSSNDDMADILTVGSYEDYQNFLLRMAGQPSVKLENQS